MTHPHNLHTAAALASLRVALVTLASGAASERYGWAAASDGLRSPSWRGGGRSAGHGDPVAAAVTGTVSSRCARRHAWTLDTLAWLARALGVPDEAPLDAVEVALPRLAPSTAWQLTLWLRDLDRRCRDTAGLGNGHQLAWIAEGHKHTCSGCGVSQLHRTPGGFLVCRNEICLCAGDACACSMPVKAAGVQHIWRTT